MSRDHLLAISDLLARLRKLPNTVQISDKDRAKIETTPVLTARHDHANITRVLKQQTRFDFAETELSDVMDSLSNKHKIPILLDRRALEDARITADTPVISQLSDMTLESALKHLLRDLELDFVLRDEALLITSQEEAENQLTTVIYPVADLLEYHENNHADFDSIIDVITGNVQPDTWEDIGGPRSIREFDQRGALVCIQTHDVHSQLGDLLAKLRSCRDQFVKLPEPDPDEMVLEIYRLSNPEADKATGMIAANDLEELVTRLVEPKSWRTDGVYIKAVPDKIVVRHQRRVQGQVAKLLGKPGFRGTGGGDFCGGNSGFSGGGGGGGGGGGFGGFGFGGSRGGGGFFSTQPKQHMFSERISPLPIRKKSLGTRPRLLRHQQLDRDVEESSQLADVG